MRYVAISLFAAALTIAWPVRSAVYPALFPTTKAGTTNVSGYNDPIAWECRNHPKIACRATSSKGVDDHAFFEVKMNELLNFFGSRGCIIDDLQFGGHGDHHDKTSRIVARTSLYVGCTYNKSQPHNEGLFVKKTTEHARYDFDCLNKLYKYYASGFDFFNNGAQSHWDSQGTSRELPWAPVSQSRYGVPDNIAQVYSLVCL